MSKYKIEVAKNVNLDTRIRIGTEIYKVGALGASERKIFLFLCTDENKKDVVQLVLNPDTEITVCK